MHTDSYKYKDIQFAKLYAFVIIRVSIHILTMYLLRVSHGNVLNWLLD